MAFFSPPFQRQRCALCGVPAVEQSSLRGLALWSHVRWALFCCFSLVAVFLTATLLLRVVPVVLANARTYRGEHDSSHDR